MLKFHLMIKEIVVLLSLVLFASTVFGQVAQQGRFEILGTVISDTAASKIVMPLGANGVMLSEDGKIDDQKLRDELREEGRSISEGDIVTVTAIDFEDGKIEIELNGGGKNKKGILDRLEVGMGRPGSMRPVRKTNNEPAKGSKIVLSFNGTAPVDLNSEGLRLLLSPILDFNKRNFMDTGIDSLPEEFRKAVLEKEARIGMDRATVLMALGRPTKKVRETLEGIDVEDWIYIKRGLRADFITFEGDLVVRIRRY